MHNVHHSSQEPTHQDAQDTVLLKAAQTLDVGWVNSCDASECCVGNSSGSQSNVSERARMRREKDVSATCRNT